MNELFPDEAEKKTSGLVGSGTCRETHKLTAATNETVNNIQNSMLFATLNDSSLDPLFQSKDVGDASLDADAPMLNITDLTNPRRHLAKHNVECFEYSSNLARASSHTKSRTSMRERISKDGNVPSLSNEFYSSFSPYEILNIPETASNADIRQAYKRLMLKTHPDKIENQGGSPTYFHVVHDAYEALLQKHT